MEVFGWQGLEDGKLSSAVFFFDSAGPMFASGWRGPMTEGVFEGLESMAWTWALEANSQSQPQFFEAKEADEWWVSRAEDRAS